MHIQKITHLDDTIARMKLMWIKIEIKARRRLKADGDN